MYTPTGSTLRDVEEQYGLLIEEYGGNAYVQLDEPEPGCNRKQSNPYSILEPTFTLIIPL